MKFALLLGLSLLTTSANFDPKLGSLPSSAPGSCSVSKPLNADDKPCCKLCRKGKACGNTCIARNKQCHQPPGCACDT